MNWDWRRIRSEILSLKRALKEFRGKEEEGNKAHVLFPFSFFSLPYMGEEIVLVSSSFPTPLPLSFYFSLCGLLLFPARAAWKTSRHAPRQYLHPSCCSSFTPPGQQLDGLFPYLTSTVVPLSSASTYIFSQAPRALCTSASESDIVEEMLAMEGAAGGRTGRSWQGLSAPVLSSGLSKYCPGDLRDLEGSLCLRSPQSHFCRF